MATETEERLTEDGLSNTEGSPVSTSYTREQKIILLCVFIGQFFSNACFSLPAPFLPHENEKHNVTGDITGWMLSVLPLLQLVLCPVFGKAMPTLGVHTTLVFGLFFGGGSTSLFGLLHYLPTPAPGETDTVYIALAFVIRAGQAAGASASITSGMTLVSIAFPDNTTTVLGYSETVIGLGVMGGPALGSGLYSLGGFPLVFLGVGITMVVCSAIMYFILPFHVGVAESEEGDTSVLQLLSNANVAITLILISYAGIIWASIDPILEPELRHKFGLTEEYSALSFLLLSVSYSVISPLMGRFLDAFSNVNGLWVMLIGFTASAGIFLLAGPSPLIPALQRPLWLLLLCVALLGVSLGFMLVPSFTIIFNINVKGSQTDDRNILSPSTKGLLSGMWASTYSFGDFAGPAFSGTVTEKSSFGWTMTYYSFGCIAMVLLILTFQLFNYCKLRKQANTHRKLLVCHNDPVNSPPEERTALLNNRGKELVF